MKIYLGLCGNIAGEEQPHERLRHRFTPRHVCRQLLLAVRNGHTSEANSLREKRDNAPGYIISTGKEKPRYRGLPDRQNRHSRAIFHADEKNEVWNVSDTPETKTLLFREVGYRKQCVEQLEDIRIVQLCLARHG